MGKHFTTGYDPRRNTKGRPKGAKDRTGETYRQMIKQIVCDNWDAIQKGMDAMDAKEKALFVERLIKNYVVSPPTNWIEAMSDSDFDILLQRIKEDAANN